MEARGWHVLNVPHMDWYSLPGLPERSAYLAERLAALGWEFSAAGAPAAAAGRLAGIAPEAGQ